jgi:hypothetical protein
MQHGRLDSTPDRESIQPQRLELGARDHAVLLPRETRDGMPTPR